MKTINQCMQLKDTMELSRCHNWKEAKFVKYDKVTSSVTFIDGDGDRNTVPIHTWLSWDIWGYSNITRNLVYMQEYVCVTNTGTKVMLTYFGDGVFSKMDETQWRLWNTMKFTEFNPKTYSISQLSKINGAIVTKSE